MSNCSDCGTPMICPRCIGAQGGSAKSEAKARAVRENGKLGGRPKKRRKPKRHNTPAETRASRSLQPIVGKGE